MSDIGYGVLQSYVDKWLVVQLQQCFVLVFVDLCEYVGYIVLVVLEQELFGVVYGICELQVVVVKLNWWVEELVGVVYSGGCYLLIQVLFDDE